MTATITYQELLNTIYTRYSGNVTYGLERMVALLEDMGNPQNSLQGFHIAGTNGKGSTSAMCEAIAIADGKTTGLNTSPHLLDYSERFRINGKNIDSQVLVDAYIKWQPFLDKWEASFFEISTALAFYIFKEKQLDVSIFEVGLGGRLDGTNPFNSTVSVITTISLDHRKTLGDTIVKIAAEKAGIIKEGVPVITGKLDPDALEVIKTASAEKNAPLICYGKDYYVENVTFNNYGTEFDLIIKSEKIPLPHIFKHIKTNMIGQHQAKNAALAIIADTLYKIRINENINIDILRKGLMNVNWLGRMQIISSAPPAILDCAHNEEGIENLVINLSILYPQKKFLFVVAILRDKDFRKMINCMSSIAKKIFIAKNSSERAADAEEQADIVNSAGIPYSIGETVMDAYKKALTEALDDDIIIVTGSIYTVSEIIRDNSTEAAER